MRVNRRELMLAGSLAVAGCASSAGGAGGLGGLVGGAAPKLYYLGQAKVFSLDPAGKPVTLVDDTPKDGSRPAGVNDGIAVHRATGQIFWTNMGKAAENDGYITRCDRDGANVTPIVKPGGTFTPKQLKIDETAGNLYCSDREGMAIQRCNLDGSGIETIVITGNPKANKGDQARW